MNKYGKFAQETWKMTAPKQYALIPDPDEWFRQLGEEAAQSVEELTRQIAGPDSMTETFLEKYGRLTASQNQAEEIVRAEMLTPDEMETEGDEETEEDEVDRQRRELRESFREESRLQRELLGAYREIEMDQYNQKP
ncbi:TnpV protein [Arthrobacter sp. H20]|uniref:TnpV protein n=1 Tax=Arthrobacter sp. H20 TaxID=1267981 RepID=UPI0009DF96F6|nr:TnpV protein [Arthrobacter sp. H20]